MSFWDKIAFTFEYLESAKDGFSILKISILDIMAKGLMCFVYELSLL